VALKRQIEGLMIRRDCGKGAHADQGLLRSGGPRTDRPPAVEFPDTIEIGTGDHYGLALGRSGYHIRERYRHATAAQHGFDFAGRVGGKRSVVFANYDDVCPITAELLAQLGLHVHI
jgi:hypothetical protein